MVYKDFYREKDGGLQAIVSYKNDMGKWKQKSKQGFENSRKGKNEAKEWVRQTLLDLKNLVKDKGDYEEITYKEFVDKFLELKKQTVEYNTYITYKNSLWKFKSLYNKQMSKITPLDIKEACNSLLKNNCINYHYSRLKSLFRAAVDEYEIINNSPCKKFNINKNKKEKYALSIEEQHKLISFLDKEYKGDKIYLFTLLALKCGLRQGEILGLTWLDINFEKSEITINKQWKRTYNSWSFGETKNKIHRTVPAPSIVLKELKNYKNSNPLNIDNRIFSNNVLNDNCKRVYSKINLDNISVHNLRHTYTTNLIANGIDFKTTAKLIGDTVEMVMKFYSHVTNDMINKAKDIINML